MMHPLSKSMRQYAIMPHVSQKANALLREGANMIDSLHAELEFERSLSDMRLEELNKARLDLAYWREHAKGGLR